MSESTAFLNVDLDVSSREDLAPLAAALRLNGYAGSGRSDASSTSAFRQAPGRTQASFRSSRRRSLSRPGWARE